MMSSEKQLAEMLVPFYLGERADVRGRRIEEIWEWDFEELECTHDYIQWLFPLAERSRFNDRAPVVDAKIIGAFQTDRRLQQNLLKSLEVMLRFYGLQFSNLVPGQIERSSTYPTRKQEWVNVFDHNYLRITRILKCLIILGCVDVARSLYNCLRQIYREEGDLISSETFQYWTDAVEL
ncbi:opioid growth factor receptor-related protein [Chamaesiphon minutus]|nr:opioid growth factor receptor-related protein [Chamaesiphon minutus]